MKNARRRSEDRRRAFFIDDGPRAGTACFVAVKNVKPSCTAAESGTNRRPKKAKVTAVAIREHGTQKYSKIHRFLYTVTSAMAEEMETWIAVPKTEQFVHLLFSVKDEAGRVICQAADSTLDKDIVERAFLQNCTILTVGQRCADWFVLRQFRVTGTTAGKLITKDDRFRRAIGLPLQTAEQDVSTAREFQSLVASWFGMFRSTEEMMRGTANESAALAALSAKPFVKAVFECGMLAKSNASWLACSPDGIALIDTKDSISTGSATNAEQEGLVIASVEIKTSVATSSLDRGVGRATVDIVFCTVGDDQFKKYIPKEHIGQMIQQMIVLCLNYVIYISAAEVGLM